MKYGYVSQRSVLLSDRGETRDCLDRRLFNFFFDIGYYLVQVPNSDRILNNKLSKDQLLSDIVFPCNPSLIILSGGDDLNSCELRDKVELALLDFAFAKSVPVIGICRGMQMICAHFGVGLTPVQSHAATRHYVTGLINREVNSYHNYGVKLQPEGFEVLARSADGCVEAIRHEGYGVLAMMWHPEREMPADDRDKDLINSFLDNYQSKT